MDQNDLHEYSPIRRALDHAEAAGAKYATVAMVSGGIDAWAMPESPLSGEWADDPTDSDVVRDALSEAGIDLDPSDLDEHNREAIVEAWLKGYDSEVQSSLDDEQADAERANRGVVTYSYQADEVGADALVARLTTGDRSWIARGILSPAAADLSAEDLLDQAAAYLGIDRGQEWSFDSDDFPKVARLADGSWVA